MFRIMKYRPLRPVFTAMFAAILAMVAVSARAIEFSPVRDRGVFIKLVEGRALIHIGVKLSVARDGRITGRAFGRKVTGRWSWSDGYFCRSMQWGPREIPKNCQAVGKNGSTLRFQSDRGTGEYADLTLR